MCWSNRAGKYEEALGKFETILGLKPDIKEEGVASYNVACCYSKLNQVPSDILLNSFIYTCIC